MVVAADARWTTEAGAGFPKLWDHRFPRFKKPVGIPVKPVGSLRFQNLATVWGGNRTGLCTGPDRFRVEPVEPPVLRTLSRGGLQHAWQELSCLLAVATSDLR
jgi:hypothetical protein